MFVDFVRTHSVYPNALGQGIGAICQWGILISNNAFPALRCFDAHNTDARFINASRIFGKVPMDRMQKLVAARSRALEISAIKEMSILSARISDAASLAWGLPSFRTPEPICAAVARALETDPKIGMYALPGGLPELLAAAANAHEKRTKQRVDPDQRVVTVAIANKTARTAWAL